MRIFGFALTLIGLWIIFTYILLVAFGPTVETYLLAAVALAGILSSFFIYRYYGWPYAEKGTYMDISASELKRLLGSVQVIDVRTAREYRRGHIPGARHLPFYTIERGIYLHGSVAIVSGGGIRSRMALRRVQADALYNLRDGMRGWTRMGFETEH